MRAPPSLRAITIGGATAALALGAAEPARAQGDAASLIERTCRPAPPGRSRADATRLSWFLLADAGVVDPNPQGRVRDAFAADERNAATDEQEAIVEAVSQLQERLATQGPIPADGAGLEALRPGPGRTEFWLLDRELACVKPAALARQGEESPAPARTGAPPRGLANGEPILRLRRTVKELSATGDDRLTAGSAHLSYRRERVRLDDGGTRHDTTWSLEGALGVALAETEASSSYIYAAYQLQRARSRPAPMLDPGESEADKDTNILEAGVTGHQLLASPTLPVSLLLNASGALILDRVDRSERVRFNVEATPGFSRAYLGLCAIGYYRPIVTGLGGRCSVTFRWQVNRFLDRGRGEIADNDEFVLGGAEIGIELARMNELGLADSGIIAGASYRYEESLLGNVPNIDRFSAYLKYRHWLSGRRYGIDIGFDFVDGTNPESFADEHRIELGFGLIF